MKKFHVVLIGAGLMAVAFVAVIVGTPTEEIDKQELRRRVNSTFTDWANYHEDLKAQIGSTPVARWKGQPVRSHIENNTISIVFQVTGYWAETDVNLPLLIRDPLGRTFPETTSTREASDVTYIFRIPGNDNVQIPWIELRYPHATRRIAYTDGSWEPGQAN